MASLPGKARSTEKVVSFTARAQRIPQNLRVQGPDRARLAHMWSVWGDEPDCERPTRQGARDFWIREADE